MIDKETQKGYATPDRFDRTKKAEQYQERTDETLTEKAGRTQLPQKDSSRRPFKPVDYETPADDDEPGYKEW